MKRTLLLLACSIVACSSGAVAPSTTPDDGSNGSAPTTIILPGADAGSTTTTPPTTQDDAAAPPANGGGGGGSSGGNGDDASAPAPPSDAGTSSPPPTPGGVFDGDAGAYVATTGPSADNAKHTGNPNPAGQSCLTCHGGQRPNVARFLFGGTVYAANGTTPAAQVEVRLVEANGAGHSAYSDANGNFFFRAQPGSQLSPPAHAGARNATTDDEMSNVLNDPDCNSCHRAGGQGPLHVP